MWSSGIGVCFLLCVSHGRPWLPLPGKREKAEMRERKAEIFLFQLTPFGESIKLDTWLNFRKGTEHTVCMLLYVSFALT